MHLFWFVFGQNSALVNSSAIWQAKEAEYKRFFVEEEEKNQRRRKPGSVVAYTKVKLATSHIDMEPTTEVFVCGPFGSRFSACVFPQGSSVRDVVERFVQQWVSLSGEIDRERRALNWRAKLTVGT